MKTLPAPVQFYVALLVNAMLSHGVRADATPLGGERKPGTAYIEQLREVWVQPPGKAEALGEIQIKMCWIPGGRFSMGSPESEKGRTASEGPAHPVELTGFWMAKFELTNDLFIAWWLSYYNDRLPGSRPLSPEREAALRLPQPPSPYINPDFKENRKFDPKVPLTSITPHGAQSFCTWLSTRTGRQYRLPTEAEWEYAARAGRQDAWAFGNDEAPLKEFAWYGQPLVRGLAEVGGRKPNAWGLYDMYGNAAEWVLDAWNNDYKEIAVRAQKDPWQPWTRATVFGTARGGDWTSPAEATRSPARQKVDCRPRTVEDTPHWIDTSDEGRKIGFRLVSPATVETDELGKNPLIPLGERKEEESGKGSRSQKQSPRTNRV